MPRPVDLTPMAREIQMVFQKHLKEDVLFGIGFALKSRPDEIHWVSNINRKDAEEVFRKTADLLRATPDPEAMN